MSVASVQRASLCSTALTASVKGCNNRPVGGAWDNLMKSRDTHGIRQSYPKLEIAKTDSSSIAIDTFAVRCCHDLGRADPIARLHKQGRHPSSMCV